MAETAHAAQAAHTHPPYVKVWAILVTLLVVTVAGPMLGLMWLTLITAFGLAVIKALMVAAYFMHLNIERMYIKQLLLVLLGLMLLLFAGVSPDIMEKSGRNWKHQSAPAGPAAPARH